MSGGTYKPTQTHQGTLQAIRVWQARLRKITHALAAEDLDGADAGLKNLRETLRPDVYPEFADNLDWLYRSAAAHIEVGKTAEAAGILDALRNLLEVAAEKLQSSRSTQSPFQAPEK